jgi:diguanylate cyclase (GGDEF)-like protein
MGRAAALERGVEERTERAAPVGRVLIADDDDAFRALLVRRATRMGLSVLQAPDGSRAIESLRHNSFDVLILDVYMPGATGIEVFREARKIDGNIQAIVLTASATVESAVEALRSGVFDYLIKPLGSLAEFEMAVTRALEHHYLIKENARLFAEVQRLALTDPLTGLNNRHKLNDALVVEVERARRYARPLSLIMIDMDELKTINDTYGHPAGDQVLRDVAQAITTQIRKVDLATRFGGDEFLVLLPEADMGEATNVAGRIRDRIRSMSVQQTQVAASLGVAQWQPSFETAERFLQAVDSALYDAKRIAHGKTPTHMRPPATRPLTARSPGRVKKERAS